MKVIKVIHFFFEIGPVGTVIVVAAVATPIISAVVIPIFAVKAASKWWEHRKLYHRTLTNLTRSKFGRIEGQDYTRWDGKEVKKSDTKPTKEEKQHEFLDLYPHGGPGSLLPGKIPNAHPQDSSFKTQEDLDWLDKEFIRREKKDLLDRDLRIIRAFSKALIPLIGLFWFVATETNTGGHISIRATFCDVCAEGGDHWKWKEAIQFHQTVLKAKLMHPPTSLT